MTDSREFNRLADALDAVAHNTTGLLYSRRKLLSEAVTALRTAAAESGAGAGKVKPLSDAQWLKTRTAETGVVLKNSDRTRFLENVRFAERHIAALIPKPAKAGDAVLLRECRQIAIDRATRCENDIATPPNIRGLGPDNHSLAYGKRVALDIARAIEALSSTAQPDTAAQGGKQSDGGVSLSASERACYLWPDDTDEARASRAAYMAGARDYTNPPAPAEPVGYVSPATLKSLTEANGSGPVVAVAGFDTVIPVYAHPIAPAAPVSVDEVKAILAIMPDAAAIQAAAFEEAAASPRDGIYIASKTKHADKWKRLRDQGIPIISTWIDEAGVGETSDFNDLWRRCLTESSTCRALVSYREPGEVLKGGWVEIGAALANGVPVYAVGLEEFTIAAYCGITHFSSIEVAIAAALRDAGRK